MSASAAPTRRDETAVRGRPRTIVTPEGVALTFEVAPAGDRLAAFLLDFVFQVLLGGGLVLLLLLASQGDLLEDGYLWAVAQLAVFAVQNLYFTLFELRMSGQTPGKRRVGIRVMDARGGPLRTDAVIVRNLLRILEFYVPLVAFFQPEAFWPGAPGWAVLIATVWMALLMALPLFNRWRMRAGDLVAGTIVVRTPQAVLLEDPGARTLERPRGEEPAFAFSAAQLEAYGIYELQVLEEVLRRATYQPTQAQTLHAVAERIAQKIGWPTAIRRTQAGPFLQAYYAALRARLESRMLFGRRKKDKFDAS